MSDMTDHGEVDSDTASTYRPTTADTVSSRVQWDDRCFGVVFQHDSDYDVLATLTAHDVRERHRVRRIAMCGYLKIMWGFLQIVNAPLHVLRTPWPATIWRLLHFTDVTELHVAVHGWVTRRKSTSSV